jgi:hypothetical protein
MKRVDIKTILSVKSLRKEMMVNAIIVLQQREGIYITREQAVAAYDKVRGERSDDECL